MAFAQQEYSEIAPTPWWRQTLVMDLARQGLGALFVGLGVRLALSERP